MHAPLAGVVNSALRCHFPTPYLTYSGHVPQLLQVATASHGKGQLQEQALATLDTLAERSQTAISELKKPELHLLSVCCDGCNCLPEGLGMFTSEIAGGLICKFSGVQRLQVLRDNINDMDDGGQEAHQDQMRHIMSIMEICQ
jgi:hypothetical protein